MKNQKTPKQIAAVLRTTKAPDKQVSLYHLLVTTVPSGTNILPFLKGAKQ